jgi:biofilm PGA synthesis protein PgaD
MATPSRNLHINAPELLSRRRRMGDAFITGLMWIIYSYLWAPLVSLIAWLLGFEFAYEVMVRAGGAQTLKSILLWYAAMVGAIVVVVTGWSFVNRLRFANRERRSAGEMVSDQELASTFGIEMDSLENLRESQVVQLSLDDMGNICAIDGSPSTQRERDGQSEGSQLKNPKIAAK